MRDDDTSGPSRGPTITTFQTLTIAAQFGATLAGSVVLGLFVGGWLDSKLQTRFVFTLIGVMVGFIAATTTAVRQYRTALEATKPPQRARPPTSAQESANDQTEG